MSHLLGLSELPTNDDPLSLSQSLSHLSFTQQRVKCCVVFSKRQKKKREKKIASAKNFCFKNNHKKSREFLTTTTTTKKKKKNSLQNFSSLILLVARKKERKMHFQVVNCPSQVRTLRSTTLTERERDLSFFLSLNSFVLLSFSSSAF